MRSWNFRNATLALFRLACSMYATARGEYVAATRHARRLRTKKQCVLRKVMRLEDMPVSDEEVRDY